MKPFVFAHGVSDLSALYPAGRKPYPIVTRTEVRILGLGFRLALNFSCRLYSFAIGADWLVQLAVGVKVSTVHECPPHTSTWAYGPLWYVNLTVFGLSCELGTNFDIKPRLRFFFRNRRIWWKGASA